MDDRRVAEYVKRLKRRERFLEDRVQDKEYEKSHYDRAELQATKWAIEYIEDTPVEAAAHQHQWFKRIEGSNEI